MDEVGFWYQPPAEGPAGATWALVVKAGAGHVPVDVDAGEEYTGETAQMRTGDDLLVTITNASDSGRHAWQMIGGSPQLKLVSQKYSAAASEIVTFSGAAAGDDHARHGQPPERRPAAADLRAARWRSRRRRRP